MAAPRRAESWIPYAGFLLAVAGIVYQGGQLSGSVQRNTERISQLEATDAARTDRIQSIDVRTARIEAKLDLMSPKASQR